MEELRKMISFIDYSGMTVMKGVPEDMAIVPEIFFF